MRKINPREENVIFTLTPNEKKISQLYLFGKLKLLLFTLAQFMFVEFGECERKETGKEKVTVLNLLGCKQLPLLLDLRSVAIMSLLLPAEYSF